jgi:hypothetical protein
MVCNVSPLGCVDLLLGSPLLHGKEETNHVIHHRDFSLYLALHVHPKSLTNLTPPTILPLLLDFFNVSQSPSRFPPSQSLSQSIDPIHDASLPNSLSSRMVTQETIERPLVTSYHALTQGIIKYHYPLPWISSQFVIGTIRKHGGHPGITTSRPCIQPNLSIATTPNNSTS